MNSDNYYHINNTLPLLESNNSKILLFLNNGKVIIISKNKVMEKFLIYIKLNKFQKQVYVNNNQEIMSTIQCEITNNNINNIQVF